MSTEHEPALEEATIEPLSPARFERLLPADRYATFVDAMQRGRAALDDRTMWHVNATLKGGGVAEMLGSLLPYVAGSGITCRWAAVDGTHDFFDVTKPVLRRNQFGAMVTGPVYLPKIYDGRNRTFWFFNYEGYKQRSESIGTRLCPCRLAGAFTLHSSASVGNKSTWLMGALAAAPFAAPGATIKSGTIAPADRALFDLAVTVAAARVIKAVHLGRVDPATMYWGYDNSAKQLDLASWLRAARDGDGLAATLDAVSPQVSHYGRARRTLALYKDRALAGVRGAHPDDHRDPSTGFVDDDLGEAQPLLARHPRRLARLADGR